MSKIPDDSTSKAHDVKRMFSRIARRYDQMNTLMTVGLHHRWRRYTINLLHPPKGSVILDIGCGTGDLAIELARHDPKTIIGLDFSRPMVELGCEKVTFRKLNGKIQLGLGDALNLPFPDATLDCVATAFTLRNVSNIRQALQEIYRVTRPGGRVVSLEIVPVKNGLLSRLFQLGFKTLVPILGTMFAKDPSAYRYLPSSVDTSFTGEEFASLMQEIGFRKVSFQRLALGTVTIHIGEV